MNPPVPPLTPRVSANQLGEFAFATDNQKRIIVHNHKFGNPYCAPYYQSALNGILGSFKNGRFDASLMRAKSGYLRACPATSRNQASKQINNAEMLARFAALIPAATPPAGQHVVIRRNAFMPLNGVTISVRPEILTRLRESSEFCYTKLRFSKSKASADASEIILLVLLEYGRRQGSNLATFRPDLTTLVDCYSKTVHHGHKLPPLRLKQLTNALREYAQLWAQVREKDIDGGSLNAAG